MTRDPEKRRPRKSKVVSVEIRQCPKAEGCEKLGELIMGAWVRCPVHGIVSIFEKVKL
jgi:hypothetical protein